MDLKTAHVSMSMCSFLRPSIKTTSIRCYCSIGGTLSAILW
jgi:hypothetical protein